MLFIIPILILASMVYLPDYYAVNSSVHDPNPVFADRKHLWKWAARGIVVPILIWALMNYGSLPLMPPLSRIVANYRAAGSDWSALFRQVWIALWVIVPCWSSMTLIWCLARLFWRIEHRDDLGMALLVWSIVAGFIMLVTLALMSGYVAVLVLWFLVAPMAMYSLGATNLQKPPPAYSGAIAKMKFGKYAEAEQLILTQLENCETDFDGWIMLASLYANQFNDVEEAEKCILDVCDQPDTNASQISVALHLLADFHISLRQDPVAAKKALQMICDRLPGTHLATMATHRINSLPSSRAELQEHCRSKTFHLPPHVEPTEVGKPQLLKQPTNSVTAASRLAECVEALKLDPNDVASREELAKIYAEDFGKADLAIEQLELLIAMPHQSEEKIPRWIHIIATWQERFGNSGDAYRETLHRIIRQYPQSREALDAQLRLTLLDAQSRIKSESRIKIQLPDKNSQA